MRAVHIPHEQVNDQSVLLVEWLIPDGGQVKPGQAIAVIETSKATTQIEAPETGFLRQRISKGAEAPVGAVLCYIAANATEPLPEEAVSTAKVESPPAASVPVAVSAHPVSDRGDTQPVSPELSMPHSSTRFSRRALAALQERGLTAEQFQNRGLVREKDVLAFNGEFREVDASIPTPPPANRSPITESTPETLPVGVPFRTEDLPRRKRIEAKYLASGFDNTLTSVVSVICPTSGLKAAAAAHPELGGGASALIVYETARLLRKFPVFNAFHYNGRVNYYEHVNIGFAVDADRGLKVPVISRADAKSVNELVHEIENFVLSYLNDSLSVESLASGTFTITDLSGEDVFLFHPLINQWQAAILGIGAEYFPPGGEEGFFNLVLAFDHQLAEGRLAAKFLRELRDRIHSYEQALRSRESSARPEAACSRCLRTVSELTALDAPLLQSVRADGEKALICNICLEGW